MHCLLVHQVTHAGMTVNDLRMHNSRCLELRYLQSASRDIVGLMAKVEGFAAHLLQ